MKRSATVLLSRTVDRLAFYGASFVMTETAYVELTRKQGRSAAVLTPKRKGASLGKLTAAFQLEYENQVLRWALAKRPAKETLGAPPSRSEQAGPGLEPARRAAIERLLREAEGAARDPLGISKPWDELKR